MTTSFDQVRAVFATSLIGRVINATGVAVEAAWRTSTIVSTLHSTVAGHNAASLIRIIAIAIAVAASLQPLLIRLMPVTARPALPLLSYVVVALLAAGVAMKPTEVLRAWTTSRATAWFR